MSQKADWEAPHFLTFMAVLGLACEGKHVRIKSITTGKATRTTATMENRVCNNEFPELQEL
jgi:hypothetical protein